MTYSFSSISLLILILLLISAPVYAGESQRHSDCGGVTTIAIDHFGKVNETKLNTIIEKTENRLSLAQHLRGRGSNATRLGPLKHELAQLKDDMQDLHDLMYIAGCKPAKHGASLQARIEVLEKEAGMN